jgi:hypothetical protein
LTPRNLTFMHHRAQREMERLVYCVPSHQHILEIRL